jgi:hypothetical protein
LRIEFVIGLREGNCKGQKASQKDKSDFFHDLIDYVKPFTAK